MEEGACPGHELHRCIEKSRWCVTKKDLADFGRLVGTAILEGRIQQTERDPFDPNDVQIGPNIYTVNEQYIKPVTRDAGMMSWALMLHPLGLQCDLFITHAWAEGVFEFIDRALYSWPLRARHAYCCMLANPQNLDISDLIGTPQESPFAVAMSCARYVLVIPNRKVSVYMRLWCAYEAFLGYESNKEIVVASAPSSTRIIKACAMVALAAAGGTVVGLLRRLAFSMQRTRLESSLSWLALIGPLLISLLLDTSCWKRLNSFCGAFLLAYYATLPEVPFPLRFAHVSGLFHVVPSLCGCCYHIADEADRVRRIDARTARRELTNGYTGISDAQCSDLQDAAAISLEIGTKREAVDEAIHVLIDAGVWTANLRRATEVGVDVRDAGHADFAATLAITGFTLYVAGLQFWVPDFSCTLIGAAILAAQISILVALVCQQQDSRAFGVKAAAKLAAFWVVSAVLVHIVLVGTEETLRTDVVVVRLQGLLCLVFHGLVITLTLVGMGHVAQLPVFGRWLAHALMARGCCSCRTCCSQDNTCLGEQASSEEADSTQSSEDAVAASASDE